MRLEINITYVLNRLMQQLNLTHFEMANLLNRSERQIRNYISNHETPSKDVFDTIIGLIQQNDLDIYSLIDIEDEGYLYHGSQKGIKGKISTLVNVDDYNDFSNGFYLSESLKNAITYVLDEKNPVIYRFKRQDVLKGKMYSFHNDKHNGEDNWILYIGLNRGKISEEVDKSFFQYYFDHLFEGIDILIGEIADSYNFDVMDAFFANQVDINQVRTALRFANIGLQYTLKNEKNANELEWVNEYSLEKTLKEYLIKVARDKKQILKNNYEIVSKNQTKDENLIFDSIKEKYKKIYG